MSRAGPSSRAKAIDWGWADEEPPEDVYAEFLTRTVATGGMMFMTFTPLKGRSSVVIRFLDEPSEDRGFVAMTIEDALHIPEAERAKIIAASCRTSARPARAACRCWAPAAFS
jgi:phage terminase large subunit-like protein